MNWATREEALRYFGLDHDEGEEELEDIVLEYEFDAEVEENGRLSRIVSDDFSKALFDMHQKKVGHRPDDPEKAAEQELLRQEKFRRQRVERETRRDLLHERVKAR